MDDDQCRDHGEDDADGGGEAREDSGRGCHGTMIH
jgi:hypothetical protein